MGERKGSRSRRRATDVRPPEASDIEVADVPSEYRELYAELVSLTDRFCDELLNEEYKELCRTMTRMLCRGGSPADRGKPAGWACGVVAAVGFVNGLTDPSETPHVRAEDIAKWFGVSVSTMHSKAKVLREGLDLIPLDPEFCLPSLMADNPLAWIIEVNGFLIDVRSCPRAIQIAAYENGLIPFLPEPTENRNSEPLQRRPR